MEIFVHKNIQKLIYLQNYVKFKLRYHFSAKSPESTQIKATINQNAKQKSYKHTESHFLRYKWYGYVRK